MINKTWEDVRVQIADLMNNYDGDAVEAVIDAGLSRDTGNKLLRIAKRETKLNPRTLTLVAKAFGVTYKYTGGIPTIVDYPLSAKKEEGTDLRTEPEPDHHIVVSITGGKVTRTRSELSFIEVSKFLMEAVQQVDKKISDDAAEKESLRE